MSSFDTSTNTGSTTFTNSYGTVSLLPSATAQYVKGFQRTSGWRYFEAYIDAQGGDNSTLFMGFNLSPAPVANTVWGGLSKQTYLNSGQLTHPYLDYPKSITAETGDVFMFALDMSGQGRDHAGNVTVATITDGTGQILTPCYGEIGKNGTWLAGGLVGFSWPSHGYPMHATPAVVRDSTSASLATVSLRVVTTSFAYAIPAGMVAWGDGPEGTVATLGDTTIYWDAATKDSKLTLSDNNYLAISTATGTSFSSYSVKSTQLIALGKRVVEFWGVNKAYGTSLSSVNPGADVHFNFGICDADMTSISWSPGATSTKIIWDTTGNRRGVSKSGSLTNMQGPNSNVGPQSNGSIFYFDFDNERLWQRRGLSRGNGLTSLWAGRTISNAGGPNPYQGIDGMTFSVSTVGVRMIAWDRKDFAPHWVYINVGQQSFQTFPLLPGWKSMDGSREVTGVGSVWDTSVMPASTSVCFSTLAMRSKRTDVAIARSTEKKNSGKWFFEIFSDLGNAGTSLSTVMGLIPDTVSVFNQTDASSIVATGLWYVPGHTTRVKNGATSNISTSATWTSGVGVLSTNAWWACAVDFDAGKVWFGYWNWNRQAIAWGVGANPVSGTVPDLTFTACTTMHIACLMPQSGNAGWNYLVAEENNVIGKPTGYTAWNGSSHPSITATPSGAPSGGGVLWPYGVQT